jgi:hypothetical protein
MEKRKKENGRMSCEKGMRYCSVQADAPYLNNPVRKGKSEERTRNSNKATFLIS